MASFYASKFDGRRTANGEVFRNSDLTAAHKTLPFGTYVRVTDKKSGRVVVVRINDRLPASSGRMIDLSQKAARELNMIEKGMLQVTLDIVSGPSKD